jgi:hypothetical protein
VPKVSKDSASESTLVEGIVDDRSEVLDGYMVNFQTFLGDVDPAPLFKGLPDDRCQCPHWGYVFKGKITFRYADHEETFEAGDAYYAPPGHVPLISEGCELVEFSPADEMAKTGEVLERNYQASQQA